MIFNFANLFAALWDFHRTRSNGMIFCNILHEWNLRVDHLSLASGIRIPAKKIHGSVLEVRCVLCSVCPRTLGEERTCVKIATNISCP